MIKWTVSTVPSALAEHYKIPRSPAAEVSAAISALGQIQQPPGCEEVEEHPNTFLIKANEYTIEYELY